MTEKSVIAVGLPGSGKTTFLAALWHLIVEREVPTKLRFKNLRSGDVSHLNAIASRWRSAHVQERTGLAGNKVVSMNLLDSGDNAIKLTFPDVAGESYRRMWEERACEPALVESLRVGGVMLFVHADKIQRPRWVVEEAAANAQMGLEGHEGDPVSWNARLSPTQVQLVALLQQLHEAPLSIGPRKLAVMLSAWDLMSSEGVPPDQLLNRELPLLGQYLRSTTSKWSSRVYGVSAQGGEYDSLEDQQQSAAAEDMRAMDNPSKRIKLVSGESEIHDITEPLAWLME